MKAKLNYLVHRLRESFWFLPALMTIAAAALSVLMLRLDRELHLSITGLLPWSHGLGFVNARLIMSTIAGSIITVASLVFSMTLVALTLASGQLGPRLLSLFMRDRMTQLVLGTFVATFVFSLLVLSGLGDPSDPGEVPPRASIFVALVLTLVSFGLLIAFIHHLATSLHADNVVARMASALTQQIEKLSGAAARSGETGSQLDNPWVDGQVVESAQGGYLQTIDVDALVALAEAQDTEIKLLYRAGNFVCSGEAIALVRDGCDALEPVASGVRSAIVFGPKRTHAEDPEFAFQAIVEIALRALSPGINDPYTALTCIDWLAEALTRVLNGSLPDCVHRDEQGRARLRAVPLSVDGFFNTAFNEIRQSARGNVAVLIRLAETLARLANIAGSAEQKEAIQRHADMLARACERSVEEALDKQDVQDRFDDIKAALAT